MADSMAWPLGKLEEKTARRWGTTDGRGRLKAYFNAVSTISTAHGGGRHEQRGPVARLEDQEPDHGQDHQKQHRRTAKGGEILECPLHPRGADRFGRVVGTSQRLENPCVEGQGASFGDLARKNQEDEEEDGGAEPDDEPAQLATFQPLQPQP